MVDRDDDAPVSFSRPLRPTGEAAERRRLSEEEQPEVRPVPHVRIPSEAVQGLSTEAVDLSTVRVRHRQRPAAIEAPTPVPETPPEPDDDFPAVVETIDTIRRGSGRPMRVDRVEVAGVHRVTQASIRARRALARGDYREPEVDMLDPAELTLQQETDDEFDRRFLAEAREAFGDGFIAAANLPADIGDRVRHVVMLSQTYAREFIYSHLERMMVTGVPMDAIAARFRVAVSTVQKWRREMVSEYGSKVKRMKRMDLEQIIGEHMSLFQMRMQLGMQLAQKQSATIREIRTGLEVAERAHVNLVKYQEMLGLYVDQPLKPAKDVANASDDKVLNARRITNVLSDIIGSGDVYAIDDDVNSEVG